MVDAANPADLFGLAFEVRSTLRIEGQEDHALTVLSLHGNGAGEGRDARE